MVGIDMTGKVTLITGAGGGIGGGIADVFAAAGALVYGRHGTGRCGRAKADSINETGMLARARSVRM